MHKLTCGYNEINALRCVAALGQVMLFVDGMNGVISHIGTVQWLYTLCAANVSINNNRFILITVIHLRTLCDCWSDLAYQLLMFRFKLTL